MNVPAAVEALISFLPDDVPQSSNTDLNFNGS